MRDVCAAAHIMCVYTQEIMDKVIKMFPCGMATTYCLLLRVALWYCDASHHGNVSLNQSTFAHNAFVGLKSAHHAVGCSLVCVCVCVFGL